MQESKYIDYEKDEGHATDGCAYISLMAIFAAIFFVVMIFAGCKTQTITQREVIYQTDSTTINAVQSENRALRAETAELRTENSKLNERIKTLENATIVEKTMKFDSAGNVTETKEKLIDYSKTTESEIFKELSKINKKQEIIIDSLANKLTFTQENFRNYVQNSELQQVTDVEKPSFWQKIKSSFWCFLAGVVVGVAGWWLVKKFILKC